MIFRMLWIYYSKQIYFGQLKNIYIFLSYLGIMFYDKPYAEMYRQLIQIGIENSQKNNKQCERAS